MNHKLKINKKTGFTVTEMTIVVLILGVLAGIGFNTYVNTRHRFEFTDSLTKIVTLIKEGRNFAVSSRAAFAGGESFIPKEGYGVFISHSATQGESEFVLFANTKTAGNDAYEYNPPTVLKNAISPGDTTIAVDDVNGANETGNIYIDNETISYTNVDTAMNEFEGATVTESHSQDSEVLLDVNEERYTLTENAVFISMKDESGSDCNTATIIFTPPLAEASIYCDGGTTTKEELVLELKRAGSEAGIPNKVIRFNRTKGFPEIEL